MPDLSQVEDPDLDLGALVSAVQRNCDISDAHFAGDLTMCTFLLKMRELYRWEKGIPLNREMPKAEVGNWMSIREEMWKGIEDADYEHLPLPSGAIDPFESTRANQALAPRGLVYSGGYGRSCRPHFFLGKLLREEWRDGFRILVSGREHARGLDAPPGVLLDSTVFVRTEALQRWLWEKVEEWSWNHRNAALGRALAYYPFGTDMDAALTAMTSAETESVILHELGEARANATLGEAWPAMLVDLMGSRAEIMARAVRDLYADSLSTLPALFDHGAPASIHFYFANFVGMRRKLFPELAQAYDIWVDHADRNTLHQVAEAGALRWLELAGEMLEQHRRHGEGTRARIEAQIEAFLQ